MFDFWTETNRRNKIVSVRKGDEREGRKRRLVLAYVFGLSDKYCLTQRRRREDEAKER